MTRQIKPGLVALYDIWPGNGAGLFLHPQSHTGRSWLRSAVYTTI